MPIAKTPTPPVTNPATTPAAKPQVQPAQTFAFVPETPTPTNRPTAIGSGVPHTQVSMLHDLASLALDYATPVGPGQVTAGQQQVLNAWKQNAQSSYSQFMLGQGLQAVSQTPSVLFAEEAASTAQVWSLDDTRNAMSMLKLSASDYDAYVKYSTEKQKSAKHTIFGVAELAAGIAIDYFSVGSLAAVGTPIAVAGAESIASG